MNRLKQMYVGSGRFKDLSSFNKDKEAYKNYTLHDKDSDYIGLLKDAISRDHLKLLARVARKEGYNVENGDLDCGEIDSYYFSKNEISDIHVSTWDMIFERSKIIDKTWCKRFLILALNDRKVPGFDYKF